MLITALAVPVEARLLGIPVTCTHQEVGFTSCVAREKTMQTFSILGVIVDGAFVPVTEPAYTPITGADFDALAAGPGFGAAVAEVKAKIAEIASR